MIGYKAFDKDLCCRGFQFEVGKTYTKDTPKDELELCTDKVFHFCRYPWDIERASFYTLSECRICEVISGAEVVEDGGKCGTNSLTILREIVGEEKEILCNWNSGSRNSGDHNSGHRNSGSRNSGDRNSGHRNSGSRNSGDCNLGNWNSGDCNSGNRNSGNWNSGNRNSGNWNLGDHNSGSFNTISPAPMWFNKPAQAEGFECPSWLYFELTQFVSYDTATDEERKIHEKDIEVCGGFLKTLSYKEAFKRAYDNAEEEERDRIFELPNFDPDIFLEISGIDTRERFEQWRKKND